MGRCIYSKTHGWVTIFRPSCSYWGSLSLRTSRELQTHFDLQWYPVWVYSSYFGVCWLPSGWFTRKTYRTKMRIRDMYSSVRYADASVRCVAFIRPSKFFSIRNGDLFWKQADCLFRFVTYSDMLSGEHPCFWCELCYRLFHYDVEGKLIQQNFQVFPYYHD